jgi:hypothetical protein
MNNLQTCTLPLYQERYHPIYCNVVVLLSLSAFWGVTCTLYGVCLNRYLTLQCRILLLLLLTLNTYNKVHVASYVNEEISYIYGIQEFTMTFTVHQWTRSGARQTQKTNSYPTSLRHIPITIFLTTQKN